MIEELQLRANGLSFRALAAGPADGTPLLCLHGFPEGAESWTPQLEALSARGVRVVAPDLRGYGGTDAPAEPSEYEIDRLVADISGLLDALGWDSAHVAGHDWGALVGWVFISQNPSRTRTWTALSVGHPVALAEAALDPDQRRRSAYIVLLRQQGKAEQVLAEDGFRRLRQMYRLGHDRDVIPPAIVDSYIEGFSRPERLTAPLNYYRVALTELPGAMRPVTVPSRLVWGTDDPAVGPLGARGTAAKVDGPYRLIELEGAGHWLQFERPDEVSAALLDHVQVNN